MRGVISIILYSTMLASVFVGSSITANAEINDFIVDNYKFKLLDDNTLELAEYTGTEKTITIPDTVEGYTVTQIGVGAFEENEHITSVTIPDTVTIIEDKAFLECINLTDITIPDTVTAIKGDSFVDTGFYSDESNWENGAFYINNHFVYSNHTLPDNYTIKDGTVSISNRAQTHLKKVTIPATVKFIELDALSFYFAEEINVVYENDYYHSVDGVLFDSKNNILLRYPLRRKATEFKIPDGITGILPYAFYSCKLTTLRIPDSVNQYGGLKNCALEEIDVEHGSDYYYSVDGVLFEKTTKKLLIYPSEKKQRNYKIPDGVWAISDYAFNNCNVSTLTIPASVKEINAPMQLFPDNNLNVAHIDVDSNNEYYYSVDGVLFEKQTKRLVKYPPKKNNISYTVPDDVKIIGISAFFGANVSKITVPENVIAIEGNAFSSSFLEDITILNPDCNINDYAISSSNDVKIHGYKDSTAKKYAHSKNLNFVSINKSKLTTENNSDSDFVIYLLNSPAVKLSLVAVLILLLVLLFIKSKKNKKVANQQIISTQANSDEITSDEITPDQITPDQIPNQITLDL